MPGSDASGTLLIRLEGTFDEKAAREVLARVSAAPPTSEIYVDLARVRDFHDHGVALLAEAIGKAHRRVSVRGLRQHQYRMLRYLGVDPAALDPGLAPRRAAPHAETA